jgi:hypothetical protein
MAHNDERLLTMPPAAQPLIPDSAQALTSSHLLRTMQGEAMRNPCPGPGGHWCGYPRTVLGGHYNLHIDWANKVVYANITTLCQDGHELPLNVVVLDQQA